MSANAAIGVLLFAVVIYVVVNDIFRGARLHGLQRRLSWERNRNRFGEVRTNLMRMAVTGELDLHSPRVRSLYRGLTALMRNPHEFERAAAAVLTLPAPQESRGPRPTMQEGLIAKAFAQRLDLLCRDYSKMYAACAWILARCGGPDGPPLWLQMLALRTQSTHVENLVAARERLERTAQIAGAV